MYAALPLVGWGMWGAVSCEAIGAVGMALFSGAFERWYQSTLELSGDRDSVTTMFARLRLSRYLTSAVFGAAGIGLYELCRQRGLFVNPGDPLGGDISTMFLLPHFFGAVFVFLALVVAYLLRSRLTHKEMLLAGGRTDAGQSLRLNIRRAKSAVRDGWRVLIQLPRLRGGIYLSCAHQLALSVVSYYWPPIILSDLSDWDHPWKRLLLFWLAREAIRAVGALLNMYLKQLNLDRASRVAVLTMCAAGFVLVVAGLTGGPEVKLGLGVVLAFLLGISEPHIDAVVQGMSPPDLRSVLGSYRAMLSSCFCAIALVPIAIVALWKARQGETYSFDDAVTITGVLVASVSVYCWRHFHTSTLAERAAP
jgi:hypothetical protein